MSNSVSDGRLWASPAFTLMLVGRRTDFVKAFQVILECFWPEGVFPGPARQSAMFRGYVWLNKSSNATAESGIILKLGFTPLDADINRSPGTA